MTDDIALIEHAMSEGKAYELTLNGGDSYILFEHQKLPCNAAPPRMYASVQCHARDARDYVVWHSAARDGPVSPWGTGFATVNLSRFRKGQPRSLAG
jgi:hypothetical protein